MSQHSKCSVKVLSVEGEAVSWTTKRGSRRLIEQRLAEPVSDRCVRMVRLPSVEAALAQSARLEVVAAPRFTSHTKVLVPHGFLHYPQPGSFVRRAA